MESSKRRVSRNRRLLAAVIAWFVAIAAVVTGPVPAPINAQGTVPQPPAWLEPRMLSIVDMVGFVPEETLRGAMITYATATGIFFYESGTRRYDEVEIHVRITPRYVPAGPETYTQIGCLGQTAVYDQWPATSPPSTLRLYANGQEITPAIFAMSIVPAGLVHPQHNSNAYYRYAFDGGRSVPPSSPLSIPANMGCSLTLPGRQTNLTAVFTVRSPVAVRPTYLSTQTFSARSYIGEGATGVFDALNRQMTERFGIRHDKFELTPPAGADYALVVFPPTPLDPYAAEFPSNAGLEGSGTYRFERPSLSVDHVNSLPMPLQGHWVDEDMIEKPIAFLPWYRDWQRVSAPEYFLPPGVPYDTCMKSGGCPDSILDAVNAARFPVIVHYFRVERIAGSDLVRVPLQQVGDAWVETEAASALPSSNAEPAPALTGQSTLTYLPWASNLRSGPIPPDDPTGCPNGCGWFDYWGRMVDVVLPP